MGIFHEPIIRPQLRLRDRISDGCVQPAEFVHEFEILRFRARPHPALRNFLHDLSLDFPRLRDLADKLPVNPVHHPLKNGQFFVALWARDADEVGKLPCLHRVKGQPEIAG